MSKSTNTEKSNDSKKQVKTQPSTTITGNGILSPAVKKHIQACS